MENTNLDVVVDLELRPVLELYNEKGNKSQKVLMALKKEASEKLTSLTVGEIELLKTERNTLAIDTGMIDNKDGNVVYIEIAVSVTTKPLYAKVVRKENKKEVVKVAVPSIFGN